MTRFSDSDHGPGNSVTALLGPTNTGKTHHALRRMLGHRSGMIGLPLRLLAREVYDRVVKEKGGDQVALVTGEEKIVPPRARWWVCTVESMPVERSFAFVAVDEIQLAADPERGHVFTDRLLRCRGVEETWFLGSDRIEPVLRQLVPTAVVRSQPRLSRLTYLGPRKLAALPPRSVVVAFSVARVYELAERLRQRHGGVAVVLGGLSPRVRNAQVALFQGGEVDHLVATDAIGMGLNMDVNHVALAGVEKYDGREHRRLRADELAQIAGRAGRWTNDGTFGETGGLDPLDEATVDAITSHRFPPITRLGWRNPDLDFTSPDALRASLDRAPPRKVLVPTRRADDRLALDALLLRPEVRDRLGAAGRLRLLWEVCGVPDFGNVLPEHHADLLAMLYVQLVEGGGTVSEDWLAAQVRRLDRDDGDVDGLTGRIAAIRVWTYLAHRPGWVPDPGAWQARTREVEERISDALHQRLLSRFVDKRAGVLVRRPSGLDPVASLDGGGVVRVGGEILGHLRGITFEPEGQLSDLERRAVWRVVAPLVSERLASLLASPHGAFVVQDDGVVQWDGVPVARLVAGSDWRHPQVRLLRSEGLDGPDRGRLGERLETWLREWLAGPWLSLEGAVPPCPAGRAIVHALRSQEGWVRRDRVRGELQRLEPGARAALRAAGVRLGARWLWFPPALHEVRARALRWRVATGQAVELPADVGLRPFRAAWPDAAADALGFERTGPWLVRVDQADLLADGTCADAATRGLPREAWERLRAARARSVPGSPRRRSEPSERELP